MPDPRRVDEKDGRRLTVPLAHEGGHVEAMEDEEKILAGRIDVNLPALLTKDVQGG